MKVEIFVESAEAKLAEHVGNEAQQFEFEDEVAATSSLLDELDSEELEDHSVIDEAASLATSAYDLLQQNYEDSFARISLPDHLRCASHTLDLIAKTDTDLSKFDAKEFPKKRMLCQAWGKLTAFWNKIGQSISASEKSLEVFGVSRPTPCATRWNTYYDCIAAFLKNHKSIKTVNGLMQSIGLTSMFSTEDIDYLQEYSVLMKPIASALDILQGEKKCFHGIGMVLPLLTRIKKQLRKRFFAKLGPMRDRIIQKIDER
ncbi:hypothetical protein GHT06_013473 [Daphnia sinensis]|uniref:Uncharacterized protein n=1 Tax=Daphnia sinensis TaxID=1820382 RepID=A0AAD5LB85_9CRUS|nr:hypothetical protein GHT06_013473 [Daphnia sinensis]